MVRQYENDGSIVIYAHSLPSLFTRFTEPAKYYMSKLAFSINKIRKMEEMHKRVQSEILQIREALYTMPQEGEGTTPKLFLKGFSPNTLENDGFCCL